VLNLFGALLLLLPFETIIVSEKSVLPVKLFFLNATTPVAGAPPEELPSGFFCGVFILMVELPDIRS
jgi:hypothetical protein